MTLKKRVEFTRIREQYRYGETATVGDRTVEVLRVDSDPVLWSVFGKVGGRHMKASPHTPSRVSYAEAHRAAIAALTDEQPPAVWDGEVVEPHL